MSTLQLLTRSGSSLVRSLRNSYRRCEHPEYAAWCRSVEYGEHDSFSEHIAKLGYNAYDLTDLSINDLWYGSELA
jgi:hypothetical protein